MSKGFYALSVAEVKEETPDAVTVSFIVPPELKETFAYEHGQYITLKVMIDDEEHRRAYSMSSCPFDEHIAVTVKRVEGGKVSTYIHQRLGPGIEVEVMAPQGKFRTELDPEQRKNYYLFGAGSGITPLMSILRTILEKEPMSRVCLLYGNRHEGSIIFRRQLEALSREYSGQLFVEHILSRPRRKKLAGIKGWFSKGEITWEGRTGRISPSEVERFLNEHPPQASRTEYFICGPGNMIDAVRGTLKGRGVDADQIHVEHFVSGTPKSASSANGSPSAKLVAHLDGEKIELEMEAGKTILDALIDKGYDPPFSCTAGACSTCMAKMTRGSVTMDACYALDEEEIDEGYILTCQSHPTTPEVEVSYEM